MFKRILVATVALLLVGCVGLTWRSAMAPIAPPAADSFEPARVAIGARLAAAGNCADCHTAPGGPAYGGGVGIETGFGLVFSTNISPDSTTGIGTWSEAAFARAMREGVTRDGSHLLPAFPYTHFARLTDDDVGALYAYFMTRTAVAAPDRVNTLSFPFNLRALQVGWKLLYFDRGPFREDAAKGDAWNRGAYLAEGIAHCSACHTPRNRMGAERRDARYAGAPFEGWQAPALTAANPAPMPWTSQDLYDYLRTGESALHGAAAGAMASIVRTGLAGLPDADVQALAIYFADLGGAAAQASSATSALARAASRRSVDAGQETAPGANLYLAACASCHYTSTSRPQAAQGGLALSSAVTADDPGNFIQTVLQGVGGAGTPGPYMPAFATALTDDDIALVAAYVRRTRSDRPAWADLRTAVATRRPPSTEHP